MDLIIFKHVDDEETFCSALLGADQVKRYRGTYRDSANPFDFEPDDVMFRELMNLVGAQANESDTIHDLCAARRIVDLLGQRQPEQRYEIVEATLRDEKPCAGHDLLGYDVSICYHLSLVWIAFIALSNGFAASITAPDVRLVPETAGSLIEVMTSYFCQRLNADGLFTTYHDADCFLRCARELSTMYPNLFESPLLMGEFQVTGLYGICR